MFKIASSSLSLPKTAEFPDFMQVEIISWDSPGLLIPIISNGKKEKRFIAFEQRQETHPSLYITDWKPGDSDIYIWLASSQWVRYSEPLPKPARL